MEKTRIDTVIFRHGLTRIYTVFTFAFLLFTFFSVSSLPLQAVGRGVAKKINLLCG
jgi:hypothetical protein